MPFTLAGTFFRSITDFCLNVAMPAIVAFLNFKGGVGKTSNVVNLGACLAATHDKRVLIVDLDAQRNAGLWLLGKTALEAHTQEARRSITQLFRDRIEGTHRFLFADAIVRGVPLSPKGYRLIGNLDLLPSTVGLLDVEGQLARLPGNDGYRFLTQRLGPHLRPYDYVLLDCAPNFFGITRNAVVLANHIAVPYIPDYLSLAGFHELAGLVEGLGGPAALNRRGPPARSRISAIIVNRYQQQGNVYRQGLLELEKLTQDLKGQGLIHPAAKVLDPPVRTCVKVAEAPAEHRPIVLHAPSSIGGTDYAALTQSFIRHFEEMP